MSLSLISTNKTARLIGFLYLLSTIAAIFNLIYIPSRMIVRGNASATAERILAAQTLYRIDIGVWSIAAFLFTVIAILLYSLVKDINRPLAWAMVALVLIQIPQVFVRQMNQIATLILVRGADFLSVFDRPQRESLAMLFINLNNQGTVVALTFWGLWLLPLGWLVLRARIMPRVIGVWLILNGMAYVINSFMAIIWPQFQEVTLKATLPFFFGEITFMLWLLIKGVNFQQKIS